MKTRIDEARRLAADPLVVPLRRVGGLRLGERGSMPQTRQGANVLYMVRRLKRDAPDVAARLAAGEFRSVAEAARAAGFSLKRASSHR